MTQVLTRHYPIVFLTILGLCWGDYRDHGKEHGNYRDYMGLYWDYIGYILGFGSEKCS